MKIPGVFFAIILTILSPASTTFTDMSIPQNLQGCFTRMSRSSDSYPIFSPASRQRYCLDQHLNKRHRADWLRESPLIPDTNEFKAPDLTPFEPQFNGETSFWSPPVKQWQFPRFTNFWQPRTRFWPVVQPSFNNVWKPTTKAPQLEKIWKTNYFPQSQKSKSTTSESTFATRPKVFRTTTIAPFEWRPKPLFNNVPSNPPQRTRFWRAPIWSVVPNYIQVLGRRFNNQWRYPNLALDYSWNEFDNTYNIPEYPLIAVETIPE